MVILLVMYVYIYIYYMCIYIYIYICRERERERERCIAVIPVARVLLVDDAGHLEEGGPDVVVADKLVPEPVRLHPVSITRFPLRRFSPGAGLLGNPFVHRQWLRFSRGWVRKDGNLVTQTGCRGHTGRPHPQKTDLINSIRLTCCE